MINLKKTELERLRALGKGSQGKFLVDYLKKVQNYVVDVRNDLNIPPEQEKAVRMVVDKVLQEELIDKILSKTPTSTSDEGDEWE